MAMNLARTGTAGVVGVASGALSSDKLVQPFQIGEQTVQWGTVAEVAALVVGGGLQIMAPFTMTNLADGMVDGGLALLASRGTKFAVNQTQTSSLAHRAYQASRVNPAASRANPAAARGQVGSVGHVDKFSLV